MHHKTKTNIKGPRPELIPAKCWVKDFILPYKYRAPNFYRRFCHT